MYRSGEFAIAARVVHSSDSSLAQVQFSDGVIKIGALIDMGWSSSSRWLSISQINLVSSIHI